MAASLKEIEQQARALAVEERAQLAETLLESLQLPHLPVAERLKLVEAIWDSIAETPDGLELTDAQRTELDRRLQAYERNPDLGSPWPEVKARILKRS